jgi:hypothetical protein
VVAENRSEKSQMADEKEPAAGEDPWAGLESEQLPDLDEGFDFSFEESAEAADQAGDAPVPDLSSHASESEAAETDDNAANEGDVDEWLEEPDTLQPTPELSVFQSGDEDPAEDGDLWPVASGEPSSIDTVSEHSDGAPTAGDEASPVAEASAEAEEFGGDELFAEAIASELFEGDSPEDSAAAAAAADMFEPGIEAGEDTDDAAGNTGGMFSFAESVESDADEGQPEKDSEAANDSNDFEFMVHSAGSDEPDADGDGAGSETAEEEPSSSEDFDGLATPVIAAESATEPKAAGKKAAKPTRAAPAKKKKPSMVGQMIGMVVGGAMSIPIVLAILWWGVGKDPLKVAPMVPDSLGFLLPAKLRAGGQIAMTTGGGSAPSLDDVLGGAGGPEPDSTGIAGVEPDTSDEPEPVLPEPEPIVPADTDVAVTEPAPVAGNEGDDELMALLNEDTPPSAEPTPPPPAPEPEPLDIAALQSSAEKALAALTAVEGVSDPTDPVHKKLLVECYKALAAYAQELAMLERVAADTGRPLDAMPTPVTTMHEAVSGRPELFDALARLTRDWLAYPRRSSDGVVAPVTFVSARQVGPYWRAEVTVGERPLVVLTRSEPAAAQGDLLLVTGLSVDKDVVWATDVRPAKADDPFGL